MDYFRSFQQEWYQLRRRKGAELQNRLTPAAEEIVLIRSRMMSTWAVHEIGYGVYEVRDNHIHATVNMTDHFCSCFQWQKSGLPCGHAIAAARYMGRRDCSDLAVTFFSSETYRSTYAEVINPVGPPEAWVYPHDPLPPCYPPLKDKNRAGRPRKVNRRPSRGEGSTQRKCTRCQAVGHTRGECPNPAPSTVPSRRSVSQVSNTQRPSYDAVPSRRSVSQVSNTQRRSYDTVDLNVDFP